VVIEAKPIGMKSENNLKIAAVSLRIDKIESYGEIRDAIDENLFRWLGKADILPLPVPNTLVEENKLEAWFKRMNPDLIVLSGGNNIGEYTQRDKTESFLIEKSIEQIIPLLGICRGMQMLAVWAGEELVPVQGHVKTRHHLTSKLEGYSIPKSVNSYHDFGVVECPKNFDVVARSDDEILEAIKHKNLPIEAWMWHPEREEEFSEKDLVNLRKLTDTK
jgi:putative glutamine amidotransferase